MDLIVHDQLNHPPMFSTGTCAVVSRDAVMGSVEVKTSLDSAAKFRAAYEQCVGLLPFGGFVGLYAWEGVSRSTATDVISEFIREDPVPRAHQIPHAILLPGKYLILANYDGDLLSPPLHWIDISKPGRGDGVALVLFLERIYRAAWGIDTPWWLRIDGPLELDGHLPWPDDLRATLRASLPT